MIRKVLAGAIVVILLLPSALAFEQSGEVVELRGEERYIVRTITLPPEQEDLAQYGLLLCRADGWPIEPKSLNKEFQALQFRLGIEDKIDFYSLRKSGQIHKLRLTNNNVQLVAENGGHTPEVMMAHYNDIFDLEKQELAKLVEQSMYTPKKAEAPSEDELVLQKIFSNPALLTRMMEQMKTSMQEAS